MTSSAVLERTSRGPRWSNSHRPRTGMLFFGPVRATSDDVARCYAAQRVRGIRLVSSPSSNIEGRDIFFFESAAGCEARQRSLRRRDPHTFITFDVINATL